MDLFSRYPSEPSALPATNAVCWSDSRRVPHNSGLCSSHRSSFSSDISYQLSESSLIHLSMDPEFPSSRSGLHRSKQCSDFSQLKSSASSDWTSDDSALSLASYMSLDSPPATIRSSPVKWETVCSMERRPSRVMQPQPHSQFGAPAHRVEKVPIDDANSLDMEHDRPMFKRPRLNPGF